MLLCTQRMLIKLMYVHVAVCVVMYTEDVD